MTGPVTSRIDDPLTSDDPGAGAWTSTLPTVSDAPPFVLHPLGGEGAPLLICHATGFCGRAYEPLAAHLAREHRVFAVDLAGHGDAPPPSDGVWHWRIFTAGVLAAAAAIVDGPVHLVGHSMGGAAALAAATAEPDRFSTAYLYEPIVMGEGGPTPGNPMAVAARNRREVFPSKAAALWRYASRPPLDTLSAASLLSYVEHGFEDLPDGSVRLKCRREAEARTFEATGGITTETVAGAPLPVVVATADPATSMLAALAPGIVAALPHAVHRVHLHLGHFGPLQSPELIAHEVLSHTRAHAATAAGG